jgi:hypothetical protein
MADGGAAEIANCNSHPSVRLLAASSHAERIGSPEMAPPARGSRSARC